MEERSGSLAIRSYALASENKAAEISRGGGDGGVSFSSRLAPGFRFHPTDEELVSYYLRRRIYGRRLAVDAISDVEIYKHEPWDLPTWSKIRSRDLEWYFFTPLDRKYANRSRTNRATASGYWKTTGKDRAVHHGGRVVGMKKTLVFHAGRAPRGERTNWVMHEYRLEDEELNSSGVQQDGLVVCRIFQKHGAGPQNGAQYGAPLIDEEWEEEDMNVEISGEGMLVPADHQKYVHMNDFAQVDQNHPFDLSSSPNNVIDNHADASVLNDGGGLDSQKLFDTGKLTAQDGDSLGVEKMFCVSPIPNDGFVELNDFVELVNVNKQSEEDFSQNPILVEIEQDHILQDEAANLPEMDSDEFFSILNENFDVSEPFERSPMLFFDVLSPNDHLCTISPGQPSENCLTHERPIQDNPPQEANIVDENGLYKSVVDSNAFDMVDEWMHFFDASESDINYNGSFGMPENASEPSEFFQFNINSKVDIVSGGMQDASLIDPIKDLDVGSPSSTPVPVAENGFVSNFESIASMKGEEDELKLTEEKIPWDNPFKKGLVNILGSISAPPAMALETSIPAAKQLRLQARHIGGPTRVSAVVVHLTDRLSLDSGPVALFPKDGFSRFPALEPAMKIHGRLVWVVIRVWLCFLLFSTMVVAAGLKLGFSLRCTR